LCWSSASKYFLDRVVDAEIDDNSKNPGALEHSSTQVLADVL